MVNKLLLLALSCTVGQYAFAQSSPKRTTNPPSKVYAANPTKKAPVIGNAPKIGETLAILEDVPSIKLPSTATTTAPRKTYQTPTKYSSTTVSSSKGAMTTNVKTTTQRNANGSSTMTITTYNVKKTYEPMRTSPSQKVVVVPNHGKTLTTYSSTNTKPKATNPTRDATTVRTSIRTPIATTAGATRFSEQQRMAANTGVYSSFLTSEERKVLQLINLARTDGSLFLKEYADKFIAENPSFQNNKYAQSLYTDLRKAKGLPPLVPNENLFRSAKAHASDIGAKGLKGHNSSNGDSFNKRIPRFLKKYLGFGENITYGFDHSQALPIVMVLLIDNNNPDYGHRKNILSPSFESLGVSIQTHRTFGYLCVQDFGTGVQ